MMQTCHTSELLVALPKLNLCLFKPVVAAQTGPILFRVRWHQTIKYIQVLIGDEGTEPKTFRSLS